MKLHVPTLIARKREGEALDPAEIRKLIEGYTAGEIPDYQMSAFAMAVTVLSALMSSAPAMSRVALPATLA